MNLINAELRRLFARRFTKIMMVLILVVMAAIAFGVAASSHSRDAATHARAVAQADRMNADNQQIIARCEAEHAKQEASADPNQTDPGKFGPGQEFPPGVPCEDVVWHATPDNFEPDQMSFREAAPQLIMLLGGLFALLGFAIGASFVGAEWNSGGMMNLLLWRPRRAPVLLGKLTALLIGVTGIAVTYAAVWLGTLWTVASLRGTTEKVTPGVWRSIGLDNARAIALGLFAACIGFAVASLGRHTATALGVAVGYLVIFEIGLRIVLEVARVQRPERFILSNYVGAWLNKALWFYDWHSCDRSPDGCEPLHWAIHLNQGLIALGALVLVTVVSAVWAIRRRDIT